MVKKSINICLIVLCCSVLFIPTQPLDFGYYCIAIGFIKNVTTFFKYSSYILLETIISLVVLTLLLVNLFKDNKTTNILQIISICCFVLWKLCRLFFSIKIGGIQSSLLSWIFYTDDYKSFITFFILHLVVTIAIFVLAITQLILTRRTTRRGA